jgi:hypothetical protein
MAKTKIQKLQYELKKALALSVLLKAETKEQILSQIDELTEEQLEQLTQELNKANEEVQPIIKAALNSEKGKEVIEKLDVISRKFKKDIRKQEEKEDRSKEQGSLDGTLEELNKL